MPFIASATLSKSLKVRVLLLAAPADTQDGASIHHKSAGDATRTDMHDTSAGNATCSRRLCAPRRPSATWSYPTSGEAHAVRPRPEVVPKAAHTHTHTACSTLRPPPATTCLLKQNDGVLLRHRSRPSPRKKEHGKKN